MRRGLDGEVAHLADPVPAAAVLDQVPDDIDPRRILRSAPHCATGCAHRRGPDCTLAERVPAACPAAAGPLPHCPLRTACAWWAQAGADACRRCPSSSPATTPPPTRTSPSATPAAPDPRPGHATPTPAPATVSDVCSVNPPGAGSAAPPPRGATPPPGAAVAAVAARRPARRRPNSRWR
ncbi:hypothetical protein [Streptomyces sp. NPDC005423]|uniref:hypothetical protein n=1 Tax=Streptomyces sp. NPDC005423 TaxID=3155343 RepID=UPI0033A3669F